jgi:hypothetical protein
VPKDKNYRDEARRCRRLAKHAAPREQKILNDLADEYEAKAAALERGKD